MSIGIVATALWLIKRDSELGQLAAPEHGRGALEMHVRESMARARARASAETPVRIAEAKVPDSRTAPVKG